MSLPVLICDDSGFARKQMTRCLPSQWDIDISYASNGLEGIEAIREGKGQVVFLDLNMPEMDGYDVLAMVQQQDLPAMTIVVSGDVQEEAYSRVKQLGALDFIKKPVDREQVVKILGDYGIYRTEDDEPDRESDLTVDINEGYQEMANVALGQAVRMLAQYLDVFVDMSIPHANNLDLGELQMALHHVSVDENVSAVCQGFIGGGISGEALLMFNDSSFEDIAALLHYDNVDEDNDLEVLMDTANILIGACLHGISEQTDVRFSQGHPKILERHVRVADVLKDNGSKPALTIEMGCSIKEHSINIELLLMFTADSIPILDNKISYLVP